LINNNHTTYVVSYDTPPSNWNLTIPTTIVYNSITYTVISLNVNSFLNCSNLISIIIPETITSIGNNAFQSCTNLINMTWNKQSTLNTIGTDTFLNCTTPMTVVYYNTGSSLDLSSASKSLQSQYPNDTTYSYYVIPPVPICFPAGTPVRTDQEIIDIDKINPTIHTIRNRKIIAITKTITLAKYLVCFEIGALGKNIPCEKTFISKEHTLFYNGKMVKADDLIHLNDKIYPVIGIFVVLAYFSEYLSVANELSSHLLNKLYI
jgi:hypothetical protein